jgi:hypothetical protein
MQHLDEGTIHSWLDGALAPDEAARVEAHVVECPECASVVAEARGFIAASSRILTKLDDVPAGVVPVARPIRRRSFAAWQAAAAVLVVAVGSLVVLRNRGSEGTVASSLPVAARESAVAVPAPADTRLSDSMQPQTVVPVRKTSAPPTLAKATPVPAPARPRDERRQDRVVAGADTRAVAEAPQANVAGVPSAVDAIAEPPLRVLREESVPGGKQTLYAIASADTVTLFEPTATETQNTVSSGAASPSARRAASPQVVAELSAKAPAVVVDTQAFSGRVAGAVAQSKAAKSAGAAAAAPAPTPIVPMRTISWTDMASGRRLTLSGRLPLGQLEEIKRRIERQRATAAAATKSPR